MSDARHRLAEVTLIGASRKIQLLRNTIERVATSKLPVLIEGATGTGKELVASLLHDLSGRGGAFVPFNVCAIADSMFEDTLFGHVRGAYTGAITDSAGILREAHGGTVFLDEIGGLGIALQAKLLRALETNAFRPIGAPRDVRSDFRLVAATNEGLHDLVARDRFRADLAHRLGGVVLTLPSLDERRGDIGMLASHFAGSRALTPDAATLLAGRSWPGNIRELKQVVESALVFATRDVDVLAVRTALAHRSKPGVRAIADSRARYADGQRARLVALLDRHGWNTEAVARQIGCHRSTLYRKLKRLGVALPRL